MPRMPRCMRWGWRRRPSPASAFCWRRRRRPGSASAGARALCRRAAGHAGLLGGLQPGRRRPLEAAPAAVGPCRHLPDDRRHLHARHAAGDRWRLGLGPVRRGLGRGALRRRAQAAGAGAHRTGGRSSLYLLLGWTGLVAIEPLLRSLDWPDLALAAAGSGPCRLQPRSSGCHLAEWLRFHTALWHGCVLAGAASHYAVVLRITAAAG